MTEPTAEDVTAVEADGLEPLPEQTDNRPRDEDGEQLPTAVAEGRAPLPDA